MIDKHQHIVSSFNWSTSFDDKVLATELQGRLSHWSTTSLELDMNRVFDQICPSEQTWRIDAMVVDLGSIYYKELNTELSSRFADCLKEALFNLMKNKNNTGLQVDILNSDDSLLSILRTYLLQGHMPWNYDHTLGSVLKILDHQLSYNSEELREILIKIGKQDNVRKRIAWQIDSPYIKKIVALIEPNNYDTIISFTNDLMEIRPRIHSLHSDSDSFNKNVWCWVLNHLFVERGTLFNTVDFVHSSLVQMANHFNVPYSILLDQICVITESSGFSQNRNGSNLIHSLNLLTSQKKSVNDAKEPELVANDYWARLEEMILKPSMRKTKAGKGIFNELVLYLIDEYPVGYERMLAFIVDKDGAWDKFINDVNEASIKALFRALIPNDFVVLIKTIEALKTLQSGLRIDCDEHQLWGFGLRFLLKSKRAGFVREEFLQYCITEMAKNTNQSKIHLMEQILDKDTEAIKEMDLIDTYEGLNSLWQSEIFKNEKEHNEIGFSKILDAFKDAFMQGDRRFNQISDMKIKLLRWIRMNPKRVLLTLLKYPDKAILIELIPLIMSPSSVRILLEGYPTTTGRLLISLERECKELSIVKNDAMLASYIHANLLIDGLEILISNSGIKEDAFMDLMIARFMKAEGNEQQRTTLSSVAKRLLDNNELDDYKVVEDHFKNDANNSRLPRPTVQAILKTLSKSINNQGEIIVMLKELARYKRASYSNLISNDEREIILNHLMPHGNSIRVNWILKYAKLLGFKSVGDVTPSILDSWNEIFWKCILDHAFDGNLKTLEKLFHEGMSYQYGGLKVTELRLMGKEINSIAIFDLIEAHFSSATNNENPNISQLIRLGFEVSPPRMGALFGNIKGTEKQIELLIKAVPFEEFGLGIAGATSTRWQEYICGLGALCILAKEHAGNEVYSALSKKYWKATIKILTKKNVSHGEYKELIIFSAGKLTKALNISNEQILQRLRYISTNIPQLIQEALMGTLEVPELIGKNSWIADSFYLLERCAEKQRLESLLRSLWHKREIPSWFNDDNKYAPKKLLHDVIVGYPKALYKILKYDSVSASQLLELDRMVPFRTIINAITSVNPVAKNQLIQLQEFHAVIPHFKIEKVSTSEIQHIIFKNVLSSWTSENWRLVHPKNIINNIIWDLQMKNNVDKTKVFNALRRSKELLPLSYQTSLILMSDTQTRDKLKIERKKNTNIKTQVLASIDQKNTVAGIGLTNAGLVLICNYIPILFDRLGILENGNFKTKESQLNAVHYLQYAATGMSETDESFLMLNKVLCGFKITDPVHVSAVISESQKTTIDGMIRTIISEHWNAIGDSSVDGFRGNWFVRKGLLSELDDKWELTVKKRAYDLLINKSPFSFSIIKFLWMKKPLHVNWPY
ncbi:MAG: hypothetical protein K0U54_07285 [Bacteroidetes bacterium]|nr:hypothetical protein [Bacteroidota bacterium]